MLQNKIVLKLSVSRWTMFISCYQCKFEGATAGFPSVGWPFSNRYNRWPIPTIKDQVIQPGNKLAFNNRICMTECNRLLPHHTHTAIERAPELNGLNGVVVNRWDKVTLLYKWTDCMSTYIHSQVTIRRHKPLITLFWAAKSYPSIYLWRIVNPKARIWTRICD